MGAREAVPTTAVCIATERERTRMKYIDSKRLTIGRVILHHLSVEAFTPTSVVQVKRFCSIVVAIWFAVALAPVSNGEEKRRPSVIGRTTKMKIKFKEKDRWLPIDARVDTGATYNALGIREVEVNGEPFEWPNKKSKRELDSLLRGNRSNRIRFHVDVPKGDPGTKVVDKHNIVRAVPVEEKPDRYTIKAWIKVGEGEPLLTEISLADRKITKADGTVNRKGQKFPFLLGRPALELGQLIVDPGIEDVHQVHDELKVRVYWHAAGGDAPIDELKKLTLDARVDTGASASSIGVDELHINGKPYSYKKLNSLRVGAAMYRNVGSRATFKVKGENFESDHELSGYIVGTQDLKEPLPDRYLVALRVKMAKDSGKWGPTRFIVIGLQDRSSKEHEFKIGRNLLILNRAMVNVSKQ